MSVTRTVILQFSFKNKDAIPSALFRDRGEESPADRAKRKTYGHKGVEMIHPTHNCSIVGFDRMLEGAGLVLVDQSYQRRIDHKDLPKKYHTVRFVFALKEYAASSEEFLKARQAIQAAFKEMTASTLWRVRGFGGNPFFEGDKLSTEFVSASINMEVRTPLYKPDGGPVMRRVRDESGKKTDVSVPLRAEYFLIVKDGRATLVPAS